MEFNKDTHYFITKRGNDIILYNRFSKVYERWILNKGSNVTDKISIERADDGFTYNINNYIHKLELQIIPPKIIKLEDKQVSSQAYGGWVENSGGSGFFEANSLPDVIEEVNDKTECACSKVEIEANLEEYHPPKVDRFAKSYVLCKVEEHIPPRVDNFAKTYTLARLKKFIPPRVDNFAKTYVMGRMKIHIPPRVDNFAKTYMLGKMRKQKKDKFSTFFWKVLFIGDIETLLGEACVLHFRSDLPSFFYPAISKDKYVNFEDKNEILDILFSISGVNKVGSESYKIYIEKSDNFFWEEILAEVIEKLTIFFRCYGWNELPGSRYVTKDSSIRKHFNKEVPYRNTINKITTASPVSFRSQPVVIPRRLDINGETKSFEPFKSRSTLKKSSAKPYVYKFNKNTKRWYKEEVDSLASD